MIAMILAAGRGERLRPVTDTTPKPLVEVHGTSLLERHLAALVAAGVDTVVINLGWLGDKIVERIGCGARYGLNVIYSPEGEDILDTGGGIYRALPMLGREPFVVVNSDIYTDMSIPGTIPDGDTMVHLVLVPRAAHRDKGDFTLVDGCVRNGPDPDLTFGGMAVYRPDFFRECEPGRFSVVPMWREAADAGRVSGTLHTGLWEDVGTPERLAELNRR